MYILSTVGSIKAFIGLKINTFFLHIKTKTKKRKEKNAQNEAGRVKKKKRKICWWKNNVYQHQWVYQWKHFTLQIEYSVGHKINKGLEKMYARYIILLLFSPFIVTEFLYGRSWRRLIKKNIRKQFYLFAVADDNIIVFIIILK